MHAASPSRVLSFLSPGWSGGKGAGGGGGGGRTGASTHLSTRSAIEFLSARRILLVEFHRDARPRPIVLSSLPPLLSTFFPLPFNRDGWTNCRGIKTFVVVSRDGTSSHDCCTRRKSYWENRLLNCWLE